MSAVPKAKHSPRPKSKGSPSRGGANQSGTTTTPTRTRQTALTALIVKPIVKQKPQSPARTQQIDAQDAEVAAQIINEQTLKQQPEDGPAGLELELHGAGGQDSPNMQLQAWAR